MGSTFKTLGDTEVLARITPIDSGSSAFVAQLEIADMDHCTTERAAALLGRFAYELTETEKYLGPSGPYTAVSLPNMPVCDPENYRTFASGNDAETLDGKYADYGLPHALLSIDDPEGNIQPLNPMYTRHLPSNVGPWFWHTDFTYSKNRANRTILQAHTLDEEHKRPNFDARHPHRSTFAVDGRWLYTCVTQELEDAGVDIDLSALFATNSFAETFNVDRYSLFSLPLTQRWTHPLVVRDSAGNSALTLPRNYDNVHFADGSLLRKRQPGILKEIISEGLNAAAVPLFEHKYRQAGSTVIVTDRTPHATGYVPYQLTELWRATSHPKDRYKPTFSGANVPNEQVPSGVYRPQALNDFRPDDFAGYIDMFKSGELPHMDENFIKGYIRRRCREHFDAMLSLASKFPEVDVAKECLLFARINNVPGVQDYSDFSALVKAV